MKITVIGAGGVGGYFGGKLAAAAKTSPLLPEVHTCKQCNNMD
ncbi:2-dehydropantoate 2-reductase N-terminal domain-containing protein [Shewanella dokdonensis]|nr:2-dehydropantoate 2-reductase N-terminal domain-containing protein [Shewanella dokdonensis]